MFENMATALRKITMLRTIFRNNLAYQSSKRIIHQNSEIWCDRKPPEGTDTVPPGILAKYEPFKDSRSPVILDVEEERRKIDENCEEDEAEEYDEFQGINPERGVHGVFDVEELTEVLRKENAVDIFVVKVPPEYRYVQHMVIVNGKSSKHMLGMAEFIRKVYKYKMKAKDIIPMLEGKASRDWIALDLGNIALHIFSKSKREYYDLESLWSIGSKLDRICNAPEDPVIQLLKQHSICVDESLTTTNQ